MHKSMFLALGLIATSAFGAIPQAERDALIALHNSTGGPSWERSNNWLGAPGTECTWFGVACDTNQSTVVELNIVANNLTGTLPNSIGALRGLRTILLYDNSISGPLPDSIGQLADLETLVLDRNELSGPIPPAIGSLTKLRLFHVDGNRFTSIPREIGNLAALEDLDFSYNELSGPIPSEIGQLSRLTDLQMVVNHLSGEVPRTLGNLTELRNLGLTDNDLTGTIPSELGQLTKLVTLRLSYNELEGTIPTSLASLRELERLDLGSNHLTGTIPPELSSLTKLKALELFTNELSGGLPPQLFDLRALEDLALYRNNLSGEIPPAIGSLSELRYLSLSMNNFTGQIPREIGSLSKLMTLELLSNGLTGPIPLELTALSNLEYIDLGANDLSGPIPNGFGALTKIRFFSVYENALSGPIPSDLGNLSELDTLYLTDNQLTGTIPESFRNLKKLGSFWLGYNRLTGEIPSWIGELTALHTIYFPGNQFTGSIPASIGNLAQLSNLYIGDNRLTGTIPREIGTLSQLAYLSLEHNEIGGAIPIEFFDLRELVEIRLNDMALSGILPAAVGNLMKADVFLLQRNQLEGSIPPEIGNLTAVRYMSLGANRLTGPIPRQIGQLQNLVSLGLYANALRGPIPPEIMALTSLEDRGADFHHNLLTAPDAATRDFVNRKQYDNDFEATQTVAPSNVRVAATTDRSVTLEWNPIHYTYDGGGYQVTAMNAAGTPVSVTTTRGKDINTIVVRGLEASTSYSFSVATVTHPHDFQQNLLVSDAAPNVSSTTTARVIAPPDVVLTEATTGLVQIGGAAVNEDGFTLTNFGDAQTTVTLGKEGAFFTMDPATFTLAGGASQRVVVRSVAQPAGSYYGYIDPEGEGVGNDVFVNVTLLSAARPSGSVIAEPLATRIEVAGAPGSDSVGQARFRNRGTAALSGIVVSDQPWVVPAADAITIHPGEVGTINFTVVRSRRPPEAAGALSANLKLLYVDGAVGKWSAGALAGELTGSNPSGVSVALVTIVDTPRPPVAPSSVPGLAGTEIAWFAPGIASLARTYGQVVSDLSILNNATSRSIDDVRLFFTPSSGTSSVATMGAITPSQAVTLANVVTNVYGVNSGIGSLQLRSLSSQNLAPAARLIVSNDAGSYAGDVPLFRSDRAVTPGQETYITGLRKSSSVRSDLFVQETGGAPAVANVTLLAASGATLATHQISLVPFGMVELPDFASDTTATAVVANDSSSSGRIAAYARVTDEVSGDNWSLVDWPRMSRFSMSEAVRIAHVDGAAAPPTGRGRRRAVAHGVAARSRTEVTIFNPAAEEGRVRITVAEANGRTFSRDFTIGPRTTAVIGDAGAGANSSSATAVLTPLGGAQMIVSARSHRVVTGSAGTSIPIVPALAGLRIGQSQRFPGLPDSTQATVDASRPGTFRSTLGLVETSGNAATVRARLFLDAGRELAAAAIYRDFTLGAGETMTAESLVRAIVGASRETAVGELNGIQLQVEVISGRGAVVPFVIVTENATGDTVLRLE